MYQVDPAILSLCVLWAVTVILILNWLSLKNVYKCWDKNGLLLDTGISTIRMPNLSPIGSDIIIHRLPYYAYAELVLTDSNTPRHFIVVYTIWKQK